MAIKLGYILPLFIQWSKISLASLFPLYTCNMTYLTLDSNLIKNRSKSFSSLGSVASSTSQSSSSSSMHEFNHKPRSCYTDNSAVQHSIKRFHSSHLGKPPGLNQQMSRSASHSSNSYSNEINKPPPPPPHTKTKIAPMKEVEKVKRVAWHVPCGLTTIHS